MKIHYTATIWHGSFYRYFGNALRSLGHDVATFNDNGSFGQKLLRTILTRIPRNEYRGQDKFREALSRDWLASVEAFNPDLIILEHAPNILPEAIAKAKKPGRKIFYWMDSPPTGDQAKDAMAALRFCDKIFANDRHRLYMSILFRPDQFIQLPLAGNPEAFRFLNIPEDQKKYDVVWVGSFPEQSGDGFLRAQVAKNIPEKYTVAAFGNGASYSLRYFPELISRIKTGTALHDVNVNEIYNHARIALNIHSTQGHLTSLSARTYEIGLSGAFQLVDYREDLDHFFPKDLFATYQYADEINGLIEEWIKKPDERAERAAKIREHVLAHHTWRHRAEKMLSYVNDE